MPDLSITIASGLAGYYEKVALELHKWVDPISQEQLWRRPYPYGNSVGHLLLHVTGNLNYYIGARIAQTVYGRARGYGKGSVHDLRALRGPRLPSCRSDDLLVQRTNKGDAAAGGILLGTDRTIRFQFVASYGEVIKPIQH